TRLDQRRRSLAVLNQQIEDMEIKQRLLEIEVYQDSQLVRKLQDALKVYKAGLLFKEAGILDCYDHDRVLQILQDYKREADL
ncbi:hypothetical protein, partial [Anaerovibrio slackiae]|uniref:hypothetical protein n=1 Tax=Anaerovibrio slackiae TaxID=2652309 RepID=UPI0038649BA2